MLFDLTYACINDFFIYLDAAVIKCIYAFIPMLVANENNRTNGTYNQSLYSSIIEDHR